MMIVTGTADGNHHGADKWGKDKEESPALSSPTSIEDTQFPGEVQGDESHGTETHCQCDLKVGVSKPLITKMHYYSYCVVFT
jgi:hypothetical protein